MTNPRPDTHHVAVQASAYALIERLQSAYPQIGHLRNRILSQGSSGGGAAAASVVANAREEMAVDYPMGELIEPFPNEFYGNGAYDLLLDNPRGQVRENAFLEEEEAPMHFPSPLFSTQDDTLEPPPKRRRMGL